MAAMLTTITALTLTLGSCRPAVPPKPSVVLEATDTVYGIGNYVGVTLLARLWTDGTIEWEENVGLTARKKLTTKISREDVTSIQKRLASIDLSMLQKKMGPYATYVDTGVELKIHIVTPKGVADATLANPWRSTLQQYKIGSEQQMPAGVKNLVCEVSRLRGRLTQDPIDPVCETPAAPSK